MMTPRSRRLAEQLDAALDGRCFELPGELAPLVAVAEAIRVAAGRGRHRPWGPVTARAMPTLLSHRDGYGARSRMTTVVTKLADLALLLAEAPVPDEAAAAAELYELAVLDPQPGTALLDALRLVGERGRATGEGLPTHQTGRAARLLVIAHDRA